MLTHRRVPVLVAAMAVALGGTFLQACGGDDDEPGTDEQYVSAVCKALTTFNEERATLTATAGDSTEEELAEDFARLIRNLGDDLDEANPPEDVKASHDSVVDALETAADSVEEGGISALFDIELPTVELESAVRSRVQLAFNTSPDCSGVDSIFS